MNWIIDNWYVILCIVVLVVVFGFAVYKFLGLPTKEQIKKIKEWLLYAVIEAEKELGNGTGQLKLRYVYNWFVDKFPITAKLVSFEKFSKWVDDALIIMRKWLSENKAIRNIIYKDNSIKEISIEGGTISNAIITDAVAKWENVNQKA